MVLKNGVKYIQAADYDGACMVLDLEKMKQGSLSRPDISKLVKRDDIIYNCINSNST